MVDESKRKQAPAEHLRRSVLADLDDAIVGLSLVDDDPVESVHSARKAIKRVRATLRLFRQVDRKRFETEDAVLARAARHLGPIRDRHVAQHLAAKQGRWPGDLVPPPMAPSVRLFIAQSGMALNGVRARASSWDLNRFDPARLDDELDRTYRLARRRWKRAIDHLDSHELHQCRKAVKRVTNQLTVVLAAPDTARLDDLAHLGELLGDHHDLLLIPDPDRHQQTELESRILELGTSIFEMKPKQHLAWLRGTPD